MRKYRDKIIFYDRMMPKKCHHIHYTPLKFNIAPENWWFFPDDPFLLGAVGNFFFRGELLDFGGGILKGVGCVGEECITLAGSMEVSGLCCLWAFSLQWFWCCVGTLRVTLANLNFTKKRNLKKDPPKNMFKTTRSSTIAVFFCLG